VAKAKIAITLDEELLRELDEVVAAGLYPNRSRAMEAAVRTQLQRMAGTRLARECAKLDPDEERALADEGMELETWPDY
jgi:metal-responsive CopG/Arc/MetJ family transcriptional regulator